jgi:hypothetical protein
MAGINLMLKLYLKLIPVGKQRLASGTKKKRLCYRYIKPQIVYPK